MGFVSTLCGELHLSEDRYNLLTGIKNLGWSFGCNTVQEYLRDSCFYDSTTNKLHFDSTGKMYNHRELFNIFAYLKDVNEIDTIEQYGHTYDAWYESGKFFVRPGAWAYVSSGGKFDFDTGDYSNKYVESKEPSLKHIDKNRWNKAIPLARSVCVKEELWIVCQTLPGEQIECGYWNFDELLDLPKEQLEQCSIESGGISIQWSVPSQNSHPIRVRMSDLVWFAQ